MSTERPDDLLDDSRGELDAAGRAAFAARLAADPALAAGLARLHARLLAPLAAIAAEPVAVPPGLAAATVARRPRGGPAARPALVAARPPAARSRGRPFPRVRRLLAGPRRGGQGPRPQPIARLPGPPAGGARRPRRLLDAHAGRLPEVGTPGRAPRGDFAAELARAGQIDTRPRRLPRRRRPRLRLHPRLPPDALRPRHRRPAGGSAGASGERDCTPVAADLPDGAAAHGRGQNVLFLGGNVRFATLATVGVRGDDIYRNDAGLVRAGLRCDDAALGGPTATP